MLIGHVPCFTLNKVTLYHMLEMTIVLLEAHLDAAFHVVGVLPGIMQSCCLILLVIFIFCILLCYTVMF